MNSYYFVVLTVLFYIVSWNCVSTRFAGWLNTMAFTGRNRIIAALLGCLKGTLCTTPNRRRGECVIIHECPVLIALLERERPIPPRVFNLLQESNCGYDGYIPRVCCPNAVDVVTTIPPPFTPSNFQPSFDLEIHDVSHHPRLRSLLPENCGILSDDNKIINGDDTGLYEFPWMALLIYLSRNGYSFRCGGSLINRRYVLTAAHCLSQQSEYQLVMVRLGEHDLASDIDCEDAVCAPPVQDIDIEEINIHPQYSRLELRHDIGLIRLSRNAVYNEAVSPICLPIGRSQQLRNLEGQKVTVTGWGTTAQGTSSPILQKVNVPVVPLASCAPLYNSSVQLTRSHMCAGGTEEKDSCHGDSGGPLQTLAQKNRQTVYIQYGIVSAGHRKCGTLGWPGIYTKVGHYMQWILDTMKQ